VQTTKFQGGNRTRKQEPCEIKGENAVIVGLGATVTQTRKSGAPIVRKEKGVCRRKIQGQAEKDRACKKASGEEKPPKSHQRSTTLGLSGGKILENVNSVSAKNLKGKKREKQGEIWGQDIGF